VIALLLTIVAAFAPPLPVQYQIDVWSRVWGIDARIARAVIHVESRGNPRAVSRTGDYGLFQVNCVTWRRAANVRSCAELLSPARNIMLGTWILSKYQRRYRFPSDAKRFPSNAGSTWACRCGGDHVWISHYNQGGHVSSRGKAYGAVIRQIVTKRAQRPLPAIPRS